MKMPVTQKISRGAKNTYGGRE